MTFILHAIIICLQARHFVLKKKMSNYTFCLHGKKCNYHLLELMLENIPQKTEI